MGWKIFEFIVGLFVWSRRTAIEINLPPHAIDATLEAGGRTPQAKERPGWVILRKSVKEDIKSCVVALKGDKVQDFKVNHASGEVRVTLSEESGSHDVVFRKEDVLVEGTVKVKLRTKDAFSWLIAYPKSFKVWSVPVLNVDKEKLTKMFELEDPFENVF